MFHQMPQPCENVGSDAFGEASRGKFINLHQLCIQVDNMSVRFCRLIRCIVVSLDGGESEREYGGWANAHVA